MGLMARLVEVRNSSIKTKGDAPGDSVVLQAELGEQGTLTPEMYQSAGIFSRPPDGARGVFLPLRGRERYGVVVAVNNYNVAPSLSKGEAELYSTNAAGDTVKAAVRCRDNGDIELNGNGKSLVTFDDLQTALSSFLTALNAKFATKVDGAGTPATLTLDISAAEAATLRTDG